ncbi:hypothetical protein FH972_022960 [Carpinus fangiana]|uniref:Autophagy-related protein 13 N-terminal domain-containing protein n=1 Tax=Carpinus fangiana TaxID=176857 RepID=A0A5N6KW12_9ROSI|nr:hypothetical protein FH972_022960 [Carpinus fangiana]
MSRPRSSFESSAGQDPQSKEDSKIRQIIPKFFTKAALTIVASRTDLPQYLARDSRLPREDVWFNLKLDDTDVLARDLSHWADLDPLTEKARPLVIEIYLDTAELSRNQNLVVIDERGRRWDVNEALASSSARDGNKSRKSEIVLERWKVFVDDSKPRPAGPPEGIPHTYKKAVVMFRSLYTYARFLPAWKFSRRLAQQPATLTALRPLFRILHDDPTGSPRDSLRAALYPSPEPIYEKFRFQPTLSAVGSLSIEVSYRVNCDFRVDDSESLLSSHFMGMDNEYFRPSLGEDVGQTQGYLSGAKGPGSLPSDKRFFKDRQDLGQAYGSMSTFHNLDAPTGTSPISALRQVRDARLESQPDSPPQKSQPSHRMSQASQGSRSSLKSAEGVPFQRRVSVSFQPFKAGSLSSSPGPSGLAPPSPRPSSARTTEQYGTSLGQTRNRTSLAALPQTALRVPPTPAPEVAVGSPGSSSPKAPPISRYSSSFGHRRSRLSSGGGSSSKPDDDNNSSGRASQLSNQPGSGLLAEGEGGSSGSLQTDDDNISDFLKLLEQDKELKSFNRTDEESRDASARRTNAALSRYHKQKETHSALGDSLSSSMHMHRSSSTSSRHQPPTLVGNSVSTSSSPGKAMSPYTPHTPAIPSRLGAGSIPAYSESRQHQSRGRAEQAAAEETDSVRSRAQDRSSSGAIDIPTSPQRWPPHTRRSSSAAQRHRDAVIEDEFGMRSASLGNGAEDRPDLSLSELLALQDPLTSPRGGQSRQPTCYITPQAVNRAEVADDECRVLQQYYQSHQLQHKTPSDISWIGSLQLFFLFAASLIGGPMFDRYGGKVSSLLNLQTPRQHTNPPPPRHSGPQPCSTSSPS